MTAINSNRAIRGPVTAVPVVAGHGVRLVSDTVNNRIVVETDETVLWENSTHTPPSGDTRLTATIAYNESVGNFEFVDVYYNQAKPSQMGPAVSRRPVVNGEFTFGISWPEQSSQGNWFKMCISGSGTTGSMEGGHSSYSNAYSFANNTYSGGMWSAGIIDKVVGINRIASA